MKRSLRAEDAGLAAIEFALVYLLILSLLALSVPLVMALQERVRLERVAGHTARFATAAPDRPRCGSEKRRPTEDEVQREALRAYSAISTNPTHLPCGTDPDAYSDYFAVNVTASCDGCEREGGLTLATAHSGDQITITFTKTVRLGPIGSLMDIIGVATSTSIDMTVTAVGRQE